MPKFWTVICIFAFAVACSSDASDSGASASAPELNVAGCTSTNVSGLGLDSGEQAAAIQELNSTFNNYKLWLCSGSSSSALDTYGNSFGDFIGNQPVLSYSLKWWESGYTGWGYAYVDGDYIALWGSL